MSFAVKEGPGSVEVSISMDEGPGFVEVSMDEGPGSVEVSMDEGPGSVDGIFSKDVLEDDSV